MSESEEEATAAFYSWTYEAIGIKSPRSRYQFVSYTTYPMSALWMKDLVLDAARMSRFMYDIKSVEFYILMFRMQARARYKLEPVGAFKIRVSAGEPEIRAAAISGEDGKVLNYDWKYSRDPYDFPSPPNLTPPTPDPIKSPMFSGHSLLQYPRTLHSSYKPRQVLHLYPMRALMYGCAFTRAKRTGMPIPPAILGTNIRPIKSRRLGRKPAD